MSKPRLDGGVTTAGSLDTSSRARGIKSEPGGGGARGASPRCRLREDAAGASAAGTSLREAAEAPPSTASAALAALPSAAAATPACIAASRLEVRPLSSAPAPARATPRPAAQASTARGWSSAKEARRAVTCAGERALTSGATPDIAREGEQLRMRDRARDTLSMGIWGSGVSDAADAATRRCARTVPRSDADELPEVFSLRHIQAKPTAPTVVPLAHRLATHRLRGIDGSPLPRSAPIALLTYCVRV